MKTRKILVNDKWQEFVVEVDPSEIEDNKDILFKKNSDDDTQVLTNILASLNEGDSDE